MVAQSFLTAGPARIATVARPVPARNAVTVDRLAQYQFQADTSQRVRRLGILQRFADARPAQTQRVEDEQTPQDKVVQRQSAVIQRVVSNAHARNMQASLARVYGGPNGRWQIDRTTGNQFPDNNGQGTIGHHGVRVTDANTGTVYFCDFHQNGAYYTRG